MRKKSAPSARSQVGGVPLFAKPEDRRRRALFLAQFLAEEAKSNLLRVKQQDSAQEILCK